MCSDKNVLVRREMWPRWRVHQFDDECVMSHPPVLWGNIVGTVLLFFNDVQMLVNHSKKLAREENIVGFLLQELRRIFLSCCFCFWTWIDRDWQLCQQKLPDDKGRLTYRKLRRLGSRRDNKIEPSYIYTPDSLWQRPGSLRDPDVCSSQATERLGTQREGRLSAAEGRWKHRVSSLMWQAGRLASIPHISPRVLRQTERHHKPCLFSLMEKFSDEDWTSTNPSSTYDFTLTFSYENVGHRKSTSLSLSPVFLGSFYFREDTEKKLSNRSTGGSVPVWLRRMWPWLKQFVWD